MSELQIIEVTLQRAARRRRFARALNGLWSGLLVGAILFLLTLGVYKLAPIPDAVLFWSIVAALLSPIAGFLLGGWRQFSLAETARWVDVKQNLRERLSTALEISSNPNNSNWEQLVVADAAGHVQEIDSRKLVRFSLPKAARWATLVLLLAVGLGFVPEYRSKKFQQQQADAKVIKEVGKQLSDLTKRSLEQRKPALESTQNSLEAVSELGDQLTKKNLTRSDALKELASVSEKLKDELKNLSRDPAIKKLERAARAPGGSDGQKGEALQKQMEALQKQLGNKPASPEAIEKLNEELKKVEEAAKGIADSNNPGSAAEKQQLAESLAALSQQADQMGLNLPQLDDAIAALKAGDTDRFIKDLQAATADMEKLRDMARQLQALQAQADKLGKDLAEQLKNGQAAAAANTLNKLAEQLRQGNLSQAQFESILKEVSDAVPEAAEYGKVADLLKESTGQMQRGDNPGASESLAAAAKELENLMQQMADAESLMAAMENLEQASMCIGSCQSWGMYRKPGFKPGGNPGAGVGTWADEGADWDESQWSERWDNSGITRPDMDSRGLTERDQTANDALTPTKVKGQISPGGQMPSITLKGVSIKGTSSVRYEEAVTAAQADAQSALSQEKVPRAYQGAVKDYFDDLKK